MARWRSDGILRFNDEVTLVKKGSSHYDPKTGKNVSEPDIRENYSCFISKLSRERAATEFGSYSKSINTVILQVPLEAVYEKCYLNGSSIASMILSDSRFKKGVLFVEGG